MTHIPVRKGRATGPPGKRPDDNLLGMEENAETPEEETGDRTLRITGYITEELADKFVVSLHDLVETPAEIAVVLSSEGGSIEEGLRIVDALGIARARGCPVHTVVSGKAYSMAAIIACAGDRRTIYPNSRLMFHGGRYEEEEDGKPLTSVELKGMYEELSMYDRIFRDILTGVGLPQDKAAGLLVGDNYMNASEAIASGIMHSIETEII